MYMNLHDHRSTAYAAQAWVVTSMRSEDRYSVDIDAQALGNGCSWPVDASEAMGGLTKIGPLP
jgi:hypothetical protein